MESQRPISPDAEPRSRSYEQRDQKRAKGMCRLVCKQFYVVAAAFEYVSCFAFQQFVSFFLTINTS